jgi:ABC-type sugar transport system ATPase subunit
MPLLKMEKVDLRYPPAPPLLVGVTWEVAAGEIVAVTGPSGSGKTSLLRLLAGVQTASAGSITIDSEPPAQAVRRGLIGMVFQEPVLFPHLNVRENLAIGWELQYNSGRKIWGTTRPRAEVRQRLDQVAELLELGPVLERSPDGLSGGERQRVALGRLLIRRPAVFLLDEPLAFLDVRLARTIARRLAPLLRTWGTTAVWVTHNPDEVRFLADRVVSLEHGHLRSGESLRQAGVEALGPAQVDAGANA